MFFNELLSIAKKGTAAVANIANGTAAKTQVAVVTFTETPKDKIPQNAVFSIDFVITGTASNVTGRYVIYKDGTVSFGEGNDSDLYGDIALARIMMSNCWTTTVVTRP